MTCTQIREHLSAYLDGDLATARGAVVRGHLRECEACRAIADDEAALRDGLRALEPVDPPATLWAGVQARLAAEEVAVAKQPAWRRTLARWRDMFVANLRPIAATTAFAAAALIFVAVRHHQQQQVDEPGDPTPAVAKAAVSVEPPKPATPPPAPVEPATPPNADDITADLARDSQRVAHEYEAAAAEVLALADGARGSWSADKKTQYDTELLARRSAIAGAKDARAAEREWRKLIYFVRQAVARDEIALADVPGGPGGSP